MKHSHRIAKIKFAVLAACLMLISWASDALAQFGSSRNIEKYNTIRIARYAYTSFWTWTAIHGTDTNGRNLLMASLQRYRDGGYNYLMMSVDFVEPTSGVPLHDDTITSQLRSIAALAANYGLRVIPQLGIGAAHSGAWGTLSPQIQMNRILCVGCGPSKTNTVDVTPSYAADPLGIDTSIARILIAVRKAFVGIGYPVEYLQLAYDEFAHNYSGVKATLYPLTGTVWSDVSRTPLGAWYSLPGGAMPPRRISWAAVDSAFIANSGAPSTSVAAQSLVVNSLYRRILQAQAHLDPAVKVLIYADVFDGELLGKWTYRTFDFDTVRYVGTLATLPGLTAPQAAFVRKNLIVIPWFYGVGDYNYDPKKTFSQFQGSGLKIIYGAAIPGRHSDANDLKRGRGAMRNYVDSSRAFRGAVVGYAALWWPTPSITDSGDISKDLADTIRAKKLFPYDQTAITRLLFR